MYLDVYLSWSIFFSVRHRVQFDLLVILLLFCQFVFKHFLVDDE